MKTLTLLLLASAAIAADVESGPKPGVKTPDLKPTFITGTHEGKEHDIIAERKGELSVFFFVNTQKFDRPIFRLMKAVDTKVSEDNLKAGLYAVWVNVKEDKEKERIPLIGQSAKFAKTDIAWLATGTPEGWGLNDDASLTAVVVKDGKVLKTFAWKSTNETDAKLILEALK